MKSTYKKLSEEYYEYQKTLGYEKATIRARQLQIEEFIEWLTQRGIEELEQITAEQMQAYYNYLNERPNKTQEGILKEKTSYGYIKSVESLFTMLQEKQAVLNNPMSTLKFIYPKDEYERQILTQVEMQQLYKHCATAKERTLLSLGYGCGLRVGEIEQLNIEDVRWRDQMIIIRKGKGNKRRIVPMNTRVIQDLEEYFFTERCSHIANETVKESAFLINQKGRRMKEYTYNKILKTILERSQIKELKERQISMHSLRHSIATHLLEQGMQVEQVREFLGHSQLETTQVYTHVSQEQIKQLNNDP